MSKYTHVLTKSLSALAMYSLLHLYYKPLKGQTKIVADDALFFYVNLSKEIRLDVSCESSA